MTALLTQFTELLGTAAVLSDPDAMAPYLQDWRGHYQGKAQAVVKPSTVAEVMAVVRWCHERNIPIVPQGGNTSLCGGATPLADGQSIVLNLNRLRQIRQLDALEGTLTVEAGLTLQEAQEAAKAAGWFFPLSLPSQGSCQIGGNLSTNAGGVQVIRYGMMRQLVLGLEVVLPDGRLLSNLRGLRKDNSGYDLKQLFLGAEGTLGVITAAVLKLFPTPQTTASLLLAVPHLAAMLECLRAFRQKAGERLTVFEVYDARCAMLVERYTALGKPPLAGFPWYALVELTDTWPDANLVEMATTITASLIDQGLSQDAIVAQSDTQAQRLWAWREQIAEAEREEVRQSAALHAAPYTSVKHDISIPLAKLPTFVETAAQQIKQAFPTVSITAFGHFGDGNLHYNVVVPRDSTVHNTVTRLVYDLVDQYGGSISAEHGLGQLKRDDLPRYKDPIELDLMRQLKTMLDPKNLFNPGKLL